MKPNIWKSRKFWLSMLNAVIALIGLYTAAFLAPEYAELVVATTAIIAIPLTAVIVGIAMEDSAAMKSGYAPKPD